LLYGPERRVIVESVTAILLGIGDTYAPGSDKEVRVAAGLAAATPPLLQAVALSDGARTYVPTPLG